ncbi:MAG: aliphatic sulfonate ABC transporter substrate-binding protein [Verrucomicrobia bacterium]|nr:aliphatic sulfonate ABC transporter substrate-binding protein [Verrucomicrobiota bacterium]
MRRFLQGLWPLAILFPVCALSVGAATAAPKILRVGYQKSGFLLLVRGERTLEKRLEPLGYAVEWREFTSGPPLLEAMNSGAVDFGHTGQPPPIFAQVNGVPFIYVATTESSPDSSGLLVPQNSPLQTVTDLKGKRVAFARGSSSHLFVAQRLAQAGLSFADIKSVYLQPAEARAAFQSGAIDAWAVWDPFFAAAEIQLKARVLTTGQGLTGFREFYFARKDYLDSPAAETLPVILETLREAGRRVQADVKGTATLLAEKLGLPATVLERSEGRTRYHSLLPITPAIVAEQQGVADTFARLGIIPKAVQVSDDVYRGMISGL